MPYEPGVSYHGDEYLFKGGQDLGKGLGQALSNGLDYVKKNDELKAKAKSYDGVVKADPEVLNAVGMHKSEWDLLGAKDKLATMDTYTKVIGTRGQVAQQAADAQKLDYYKTQNALGNQQLEAGKVDAADLERYKGAMGKLNDPNLVGPPQALADQMMNAAQTAGVNPRMEDTIAQTAQRIHMANKEGKPQGKPEIVSLGGEDFVTYGGSILGVKKKAADEPIFHTDPDGNKYLQTANGWQHIPKQSKGGLIQARDQSGQLVPGIYVDAETGKTVVSKPEDPIKAAVAGQISGKPAEEPTKPGKGKTGRYDLKTGKVVYE